MNSITQTLQRVSAIVSIVALAVVTPGAAFAQYYDDYGYYDSYGGDSYGYYDSYAGTDYSYDYIDSYGYYDPYAYDTSYDYVDSYGYYDPYAYDTSYDYVDSYGYYDPYAYDTSYDYTDSYGYYDPYAYDTSYDYTDSYGYYDPYAYDTSYDYTDSYGYYDPYASSGYDTSCYTCADYGDYYNAYDYGYDYGYSYPSSYVAPRVAPYVPPPYNPPPRTTQTQTQQVQQTSVNNVNNSVNNSGNVNTNVVNSGNVGTTPTTSTTPPPTVPQPASLFSQVDIRNITVGGAFAPSASANPSEVVALSVAYRNTSSVTIPNLRLSLNQPVGASFVHTFTGGASGGNASAQSDSATLSLSGAQQVTPIAGSIFWRPNGSTGAQQFPSGQSGAEIFSGALNLGSLAPNASGFVEVHFRIASAGTGGPTGPTQSANVTTVSAINVSQSSATLNGFVSTTGGFASQVRFEYGTTPSLGTLTATQSIVGAQNFSQGIFGLLSNTTYFYRAVGTSPSGDVFGSTLSFTTSGTQQFVSALSVSTEQATQTGSASTLILNGRLNSAGTGQGTATTYFEYGQTTGFGSRTASRATGVGSFSETASGLAANTTYFYRAVAQNSTGTVFGNILSFTTGASFVGTFDSAPSVTTNTATQTGSASTFILNGRLNSAGTAQGTATTYFEYGQTTGLGLRTASRATGVGSFSETASGLAANTTYFYRAIAQNSTGTVFGNILSFTTGASFVGTFDNAPSVTTNTATLVSPVSARLNGFASIPSGSAGNLSVGWFEWGSSVNLGNRTNNISLVDPRASSFFDTLRNVDPNTTYFYRAVARSTTGLEGRGAMLTFTTGFVAAPAPAPASPAQPAPTPIGIAARVNKTVENRSFPNGTDTQIAAWGGNTIEFDIAVVNSGSVTLSGLTVRDRIADSLTLKDIEGGGRRTGDAVEWTATLAPGETRTFTYRAVAKHLSENVTIERSAEIVNNQVSRRSNSVLIILNKFPLSVSAINSRPQVREGEESVYTIRYKNEGDAPITNVRLEAVVPAGTAFVSAGGAVNGSANGDSIVFTPGRMGAQEEQTVTITARVTENAQVGEVLTMAVNVTYSDEFGEQQFSEKAFTTSEVVGGSVASAAARTGFVAGLAGIFGGFFPGTAIGWLLLIILLIILAIVVRRTLE